MMKKITQLFRIQHFYLAAAFLISTVNFAQTSKNPIYDYKGNEAIEKRDLFAKHFLNTDGTYTAAIASGPIHYENGGVFSNIDNAIKPFSSTVYNYANEENLMASYFGATASIGIKSKTKEGDVFEFLDTSMHWEVAGSKVNEQHSANVAFTAIDNKGYYNNLYGNINAEFIVLNGKRKLNYIIPNADAIANAPANADYLVFTEKVIIPSNWSYAINENGLSISNEKQQRIYFYSNPFSFDRKGKRLRSNNTLMTVEADGNALKIAIKVKANWLRNAERVFPITVDPTVTVYPDMANYNTGCVYSSDYFKEESDIGFGRYDDNAGIQDFLRGWAKFNTTSLPDNAVVANGVTVNYYIVGGSADYSPANGHELVFSQLSLNPVTATGNALYNAIAQFGYGPFVTTAINSIGWKSHTITSAAIATDISNSLVNNYFSLGFMPQGDFFAGEFLIADGWDANKPYLTFTYNLPLGTENFDKFAVNIYPNPVENTLTVATDEQIESIKIYSTLGQLIDSNANRNTIDVSSLTNGVYLTEIKCSNGETIRKKIIKK